MTFKILFNKVGSYDVFIFCMTSEASIKRSNLRSHTMKLEWKPA